MTLLLAQTLGIPSPDPLPLPAPHWLIWTLLMVTFLLHVLAMNVVLGGSILAAWARFKDSDHSRTFFKIFVKALPVAIAATITLGVPPLLFVQVLYGRLLYSSSILMGWFWFSVIPLLILAYYGAYVLAFKSEGAKWTWLIMVVAVLFLTIAFIYTNNMSLMLRPAVFVEKYLEDGRGFHLNLDEPSLLPRFLHNVVSAVAVAAAALALLGLYRRKRDPEFGGWAIRKGAIWFGLATTINFGVGVWYLFSLGRETLLALMNPMGVVSLMVGIVSALVAAFLIMQAINSGNPGPLVTGAIAALTVSLSGMILVRDQLRQVLLSRAGFQLVGWVVPDWGTITIFVFLLLLAVVTVAWMVRVLLKGKANAEA